MIFVLQALLLLGYAAIAVAGLADPRAPAWFWTVLMPLLPALIVSIGFHTWRRLCPVAIVAALGPRLHPGARMPRALRKLGFGAPLALLALALVLRHTWMNGDGVALAWFLAGFAVLALLVNAAFGGKAWCNYLCPVGFVERVYTDATLRGPAHSRCSTCTGCKAACPDIDQGRAYRRELWSVSRRLSGYAFPGIVWGFYWYFALRGGDFGAFFGGAWTRQRGGLELAFGPGFWFAPHVPAVLAASATLAISGAAGALAFFRLESWLRAHSASAEPALHVTLSLAAFTAFVTFYFFAGAPAAGDSALAWWLRFGGGLSLGLFVLQRRIWSARVRFARGARHLPVL